MKPTIQLIACAAAVWLTAPSAATAEPIAITSGVITLPSNLGTGPDPVVLRGTDGTRSFTFDGHLGDTDIGPYKCHPCVSQISSDIIAAGAASGTATYGNDSYFTGGADERSGQLNFRILGGAIPLPTPVRLGETLNVSTSFTMSGFLVPPESMPGALANTLTGSGIATLTVSSGPGGPPGTFLWDFQRGEYRFTAESGGPAPVPEPTSFLLFASGLSALVLKRRLVV
jgi:hypothetical protein